MTVAPSSPSADTAGSAPSTPAALQAPPAGTPALEWLEGDLRRRVHQAAETCGMTVAAVCEVWLREGLERFEGQQAVDDSDGAGRCSLRTGTRSVGPVPLPVQQ
jgi:hypothetical protein